MMICNDHDLEDPRDRFSFRIHNAELVEVRQSDGAQLYRFPPTHNGTCEMWLDKYSGIEKPRIGMVGFLEQTCGPGTDMWDFTELGRYGTPFDWSLAFNRDGLYEMDDAGNFVHEDILDRIDYEMMCLGLMQTHSVKETGQPFFAIDLRDGLLVENVETLLEALHIILSYIKPVSAGYKPVGIITKKYRECSYVFRIFGDFISLVKLVNKKVVADRCFVDIEPALLLVESVDPENWFDSADVEIGS